MPCSSSVVRRPVQTHSRLPAGRLAAKCNLARYAPRLRGPRKNQRIKPSTGSSTTAMIQISFFSFEAELWKTLIIAQISPISITRPKTLLYSKFIIWVPSSFSGSCQSLTPATCAPNRAELLQLHRTGKFRQLSHNLEIFRNC